MIEGYQKLFRIVLVFGVLVGISWSQGLKELPFGYDAAPQDGILTGTNGIGVAHSHSPFGILINPAQMNGQKMVLAIGYSGFRLEERRSFPVYDRFDGIITKGTYVINDNIHSSPSVVFSARIRQNFQVSAFYVPYKSFEYQYHEQVRQNIFGDFVMGYNSIEGDGTINLAGIQLAGKVMERFTVGLLVGYLSRPEILLDVKSVYVDSLTPFYQDKATRTIKSASPYLALGITGKINERWEAGTALQMPNKIKSDYNRTYLGPEVSIPENVLMSEEYSYPLEWKAGLLYRARTPFRTVFKMDYSYRFWSGNDIVRKSMMGEQRLSLEDTYSVGAALEFTYLKNNRFYISYLYHSSPWNKQITSSRIGLGFAFLIPGGEVNAGFSFRRRNYSEEDLFPDSWYGGNRGNSLVDDVEENFIFGGISIKYYFTR